MTYLDNRTTREIRSRMVKRVDKTNMSYVGTLSSHGTNDQMGHLSCFYPGLLALGAKYLDMPEQLEDAERILNACVFMYQTATGLAGDLVQWYRFFQSIDLQNKF
jgi:mannosyl-oligosaccharide alpha-1,2-mannosidase